MFSLQLGSAILDAVEQNTLSVEPVGFQPLPVVKASAMECGGPKYVETPGWAGREPTVLR